MTKLDKIQRRLERKTKHKSQRLNYEQSESQCQTDKDGHYAASSNPHHMATIYTVD